MAGIVLVTAGGLAREVLAAVRDSPEHRVVGFVDDNPELVGRQLDGVPVLGDIGTLQRTSDELVVICAGRGSVRRVIAERLAEQGIGLDRFATIVHPSVWVPPGTTIGVGTIVLAQAAITASVELGSHVVVMPNVTLTHDVLVEDFATLCAGVSLGGSAVVRTGAYIGMNASVREGLTVGRDSVLGMGAVLLRDLPTRETWVGVPAAAMVSSMEPSR